MRRLWLIVNRLLVLVLLTSSASGATVHGGAATFYESRGEIGACGRPQPTLHVAVSPVDFAGSVLCGAYLEVRRSGRAPVIVEVTNLCPECPPGNLDLSPAAFDGLGARSDGRIAVTWRIVPGAVRGPVSIQIKDGSNPYWVAIQVRNHRYPIKTLEARRGNAWRRLGRTAYGYFLAQKGLGGGPFTLRITDTRGHRIVEKNIELDPGRTVPGHRQFPA